MPITCLYMLIDRRPDSSRAGEPFYVGAGTRKRPYQHMPSAKKGRCKNRLLAAILLEHADRGIEPGTEIVALFDERQQAADAEREAIALFGRMGRDPGGTLCNVARGGFPATITEAMLEARLANLALTKTPEARDKIVADLLGRWAKPEYRAMRSRNQTAAWQDPEKRARMMEGRSEGQAQSWTNHDIRSKRTIGVRTAILDKWASDPIYAEACRIGLLAAWQNPDKKANRVAKMVGSRERNKAERQAAGIITPPSAGRIANMAALNASKTFDARSADQTRSWRDSEVREKRLAGIRSAAQDPELRGRRLANMAEGKRRKAAERAALAASSGDGESA